MVMKNWAGAIMPQPTTCKKCKGKKKSKRKKKGREKKRHEMQQCKL
jgi:hypothetical protein